MISPLIPFKVAAEQLPGLSSGEILRYGTILKDAKTGRIVAHLQETGALERAFSNGSSLLANSASPVGGISSVVGAVQNEQIKARLDQIQNMMGGLQSLQLATLATSFVGIGVTVASTAMILARLGELSGNIARVEEKVEALPSKWREMRLREAIVDMQTSLERLDESSSWSDAGPVLRNVEERLDHGFNRFADGSRKIAVEMKVDAELLRALLAGLSLCSGAQIKALLYLDEKEAAEKRALKHYKKLEELSWLLPRDVLESRLGGDRKSAELIAADTSELLMRFASRPQLVSTLIAQDIGGQAFLEKAVQEDTEPLLLLPCYEDA